MVYCLPCGQCAFVAGAMGMYEIGSGVFAVDGTFWEFYCAGTGGGVLIIGSAAE